MKMMQGILTGALVLVLAGLSSCSVVPAESKNTKPVGDIRPLPAEFSTRKAVAYSGFRKATRDQAGDLPSEAEILQDMNLLLGKGFKLIRIFSSDEMGLRTLKVIKDNKLDIKVMLGAWISGSKALADSANQAAIAATVQAAKDYKDIVLAVSVGNETMVDWSFIRVPPSDMAAYIAQVRASISQPVTTDDNWAFFANNNGAYETDPVLDVIDFIAMHTYPLADTEFDLFNWKQKDISTNLRATAMMDASINKAKQDYAAIKTYLNAKGYNMPIVIGETGWKSTAVEKRAHPVNQKMYYDRLATWNSQAKNGSNPQQIFYFEAFDEPWKEGDDNWGLWDVNRNEKYVLSGTGYTAADAVYYVTVPSPPRVTLNSYKVFADTVDSETQAKPQALRWDIWDGNTAGFATNTSDANEGSNSVDITPKPKSWGWGLAMTAIPADDLSNFSSSGYLNFDIKTTYAGKLEVGFYSGNSVDKTGCDVYLAIASGQYGYVNDGSWHTVSIPLGAIEPKAAPAYGMPESVTLKMSEITSPFVIGDRYANTGKSQGANITTKIQIDNVYWSK